MRALWLLIGLGSAGAGLVGLAVPLLPTVPFLLLASFAFARSSERFHVWLHEHPRLGPPLQEWQRAGAISLYAKRISTVSIAVTVGLTVLAGASLRALAAQALVLAVVLVFIWTRPTAAPATSAH